jgi:crotonobetainyl-CoA:carnitine CoA-transferase CaiB-like acyl-CoA transferase
LAAEGGLPSTFPVTELATSALAVAGLSAARFIGSGRVTVSRRLASAWFARSIYPVGWTLPSPWDPIAGDYPTRDGWIRLHTNAPHHRAAALSVLESDTIPESVAAAVSTWDGDELEAAIIAAGRCAAVMRKPDEWCNSPQGLAVATEPLIAWRDLEPGPDRRHSGTTSRPLAGVRVLDLTRVLAGPVATRFLALLGADVLRIDPPGWDESIIPEVTLGKRTTRLDLALSADRASFTELLATADVIVNGYRPDALERLGFGEEERQQIRPGLIDISLDAYGWSGPHSGRRGFDSLIQMSTGIAHAGMVDTGADRPVPLPVQALDHATGYLAAAATLSALTHQRDTGTGHAQPASLSPAPPTSSSPTEAKGTTTRSPS